MKKVSSKNMEKSIPEIKLSYKKTKFMADSQISSPEASYNAMKDLFDGDTIELHESVIVLYLNQNLKPIGFLRHTSGGVSSCIVDKRLIISTALISNSTQIIVAHNHPSGRIIPSSEDKAFSEDLKKAAQFFDIRLVDSLIVTTESYYSMSENLDL